LKTLLRIGQVIGMRGLLFIDQDLVRRMKPLWTKRDGKRVHARRPALGDITLRRVMSPVAAAMGRRGAAARNAKLGPEVRRELAKAAARARWQGKRD
jgi:hypothetical protein